MKRRKNIARYTGSQKCSGSQNQDTDITYIRTCQGWLYLAMVSDLFARNVVGWSMKQSQSRALALDALIMAVWLT